MSDNFMTFPSNESQAIALLYVQNQDLTGLTPAQIYDKYRNAYEEIRNHKRKNATTAVINSPM